MYEQSSLSQGAAKSPAHVHEISIGGNRFLIGRLGSTDRDGLSEVFRLLPAESEPYLLCLPSVDTTDVSAGERPFGPKLTHGFFSDSLSLAKERLLIEPADHVFFAFEAAALEHALGGSLAKSASGFLKMEWVIDLNLPSASHLKVLVELICDCLNAPEEYRLPRKAVECLFQAVITALCHVTAVSPVRQNAPPASPAIPWHLKRAISYMRANLGTPMSVAMIAREAGTSVRALQAAFKRFRGATPLGYLQKIRLEAARQELQKSTLPLAISDIARKAGFTHMGRFSEAYSKLYGETPSETLKARERGSLDED
ncbi:helix-turn-helix domain-containing protein [Neorhizobium huautlense]|uniref:helix-turn-helix domain-containing protein n=1 Tax=Neorhizobium huautlense TaxID=67774 RepID=UPI00130077B7|nr:helix-turn-helix transcriptional regulator [Neorhizobium huautlense]